MKYFNNHIPLQKRKLLDHIDYFYLVFMPLFTWGVGYLFGYRIFNIILAIIIEIGIIWAHFERYREHPVGVAYTEEGIYLKRRSGKVKFIPWEKVERFGFSRSGKYAVIPIGLTGIFLYDEARDNLLYYVEKYGVKKNPKLAEYVDRARMQILLQD